MSSISALGSNQSAYTSPLQQLEAELQSEVSEGTVSSSDEPALSSALTSINSSLTAGQSSSSGSSGANGPGDIQSKINSLIQAQVSSGALTSSQATELQNLFNNTFGNGQGGPGGPGGPQGAGGPPPGPPPSGASSSGSNSLGSAINQLLDSSSSSDTSSTDSSSTDSSSSGNALQDFLKLLQDAQSLSYGANGATAASSSLASTLINYQA
jgi:hypothetical protein